MQEEIVKISIIGDHGVGKTSIIKRFEDKQITSAYKHTNVTDYINIQKKHKDKLYNLLIVDLSNNNNTNILPEAHIENSDIVLICFDITNLKSFDHLDNYINLARNNTNDSVKILVGTKNDKSDCRVVSSKRAVKFANDNDMDIFEVSALENHNINGLLSAALDYYLQNIKENTKNSQQQDPSKLNSNNNNNTSETIEIMVSNPSNFWRENKNNEHNENIIFIANQLKQFCGLILSKIQDIQTNDKKSFIEFFLNSAPSLNSKDILKERIQIIKMAVETLIDLNRLSRQAIRDNVSEVKKLLNGLVVVESHSLALKKMLINTAA